MHTRMDAAVTVDAQTAPTATWKTAQSAVSHSAHTHHPLLSRGNPRDHRPTHKEPDSPGCLRYPALPLTRPRCARRRQRQMDSSTLLRFASVDSVSSMKRLSRVKLLRVDALWECGPPFFGGPHFHTPSSRLRATMRV